VRSCLWLNLLHVPFWQTLVSFFERRRLHWISLMSSPVACRKFLDQINVRTSTCGSLRAGEDKSKGASVTQWGGGGSQCVRQCVRSQCDRLAEGSQVTRAGAESGVSRETADAAAAARQSEQVAYRSGRV
jgi:hypothetical protein